MIGKMFLSGVALVASLIGCRVCAAQDASVLVPSDASVVVRVNSGRILDKMGGDTFVARIMEAAGEAADGRIAEPREWGVDLDRPLYVAVSDAGEAVSVLMSLADAGRFGSTVEDMLEKKVRRRAGVACVEDDDLYVVFDSQYAVMGVTEGRHDADMWRDVLKRGGHRGAGLATKGFARMSASDADVVMLVSGSVADEDDDLAVLKGFYGDDMPLEDISVVWSLVSGGGVAEMHYDVVAESDTAARYIRENTAGVRRVAGRYADCIPASSMMVLYSAIDGERIAEMLARTGLFDRDGDSSQLRGLLSSVAGDVALVVGSPVADGTSVSLPATLMAQVRNRSLLEFIREKVGDGLVEQTADGYVIDNNGTKIWMACRDGDMVITTIEGMASLPAAASPSAAPCCREGYGGLSLDVRQVMAAAGPLIGMLDSDGKVVSLLSHIESVESIADRPDSARCTVRLCDGCDNIYLIMAEVVDMLRATSEDDAAEE